MGRKTYCGGGGIGCCACWDGEAGTSAADSRWCRVREEVLRDYVAEVLSGICSDLYGDGLRGSVSQVAGLELIQSAQISMYFVQRTYTVGFGVMPGA